MVYKTPFSYISTEDVLADIKERGLKIPWNEKQQVLMEPMEIKKRVVPNRLVVNPIEGCDGRPDDGGPTELSYRRYRRFAEGGAGIIWVEATAVVPEGRANPKQLWINESSAEAFKKLVRTIRNAARDAYGHPQKPLLVLQLTHSGRQSNPTGTPSPIIAHHSRILDPKDHLDQNHPVISDEELDALQEKYVQAAQLAHDCGFDAIDVKASHGYLIHELLFSYTRESSKYGESFHNRTRFLREIIDKIKCDVPEIIITTRLNIYDGIPYPWGWGMKTDGSLEADLSEPVRLANILHDAGVDLISIALGNPYYNPHLERPYDRPVAGGYLPKEHPLETIARTVQLTTSIHRQAAGVCLVGTGLSWLRQFFPNVAAAMIEDGSISFIGLGRGALAYPGFANELLKKGSLTPEKLCITCSSCTQMMKDGVPAGCLVHDSEVYGPIYRAGRARALKQQQRSQKDV